MSNNEDVDIRELLEQDATLYGFAVITRNADGTWRRIHPNNVTIDHEDPGPDPDKPDIANETLPGPYRINPEDDNAYRVEYEQPARTRSYGAGDFDDTIQVSPDRVVLTDPLGGHEITVDKSEWESWTLGITPSAIIDGNHP